MIRTRWYKVIRDLWQFKARTLLVILSIAAGVTSVGMIVGSYNRLMQGMHDSWQAVGPPGAIISAWPLDVEHARMVERRPDIESTQLQRTIRVRFKPGVADPNDEAVAWRNLNLYVYPDYDDIDILKLRPLQGSYPPDEQELLVERGSLAWMGVQLGDQVLIEAPNGKFRRLTVTGTLHDMGVQEASWTGTGHSYLSPKSLPWLGLEEQYGQIAIATTEHKMDAQHITAVATEVGELLEKNGLSVGYTWVETPGKHPAADDIAPILLLMLFIGVLSLLAGCFLVVNTVQALLTQQIQQIGVMKAIGARNRQIAGLYLVMILILGALALGIAIPVSVAGARALSDFAANLVNFDIPDDRMPAYVYALEIVLGLLIPLLAALYPILSATRMSAREAMSDYGLGQRAYGHGRLDRVMERVRGVSRPLLLSLRNTFRRKGRLVLTLITLTLAGAIFIAVLSVQATLYAAIEDMIEYVRYDALIIFSRGYRIEQMEEVALQVPGVTYAESWRFYGVRRMRDDGTEGVNIAMRAAPADSDLVNPTLVAGRWLLPGDENALVVNTYLLKDEPDVDVGSELRFEVEGRETTWQVVGIIKGTPPIPMMYVNLPYFTTVAGGVGKAGVVFTVTDRHDAAYQAQIARDLEAEFESIGYQVSTTLTSWQERSQARSQFDVLTYFLLAMAIILALVGGLGLMGTMSLNVLERTREIGVMRAIGASTPAITQIVIVEGIMISMLSWLISLALAWPLSKVMSDAVAEEVIKATFRFVFSYGSAGIWLMIVILLAALASLWPARNASRISVREALAYE